MIYTSFYPDPDLLYEIDSVSKKIVEIFVQNRSIKIKKTSFRVFDEKFIIFSLSDPDPNPFFFRNGYADMDPDPNQNETDPQHCFLPVLNVGFPLYTSFFFFLANPNKTTRMGYQGLNLGAIKILSDIE